MKNPSAEFSAVKPQIFSHRTFPDFQKIISAHPLFEIYNFSTQQRIAQPTPTWVPERKRQIARFAKGRLAMEWLM
jgi:hypothetical protein